MSQAREHGLPRPLCCPGGFCWTPFRVPVWRRRSREGREVGEKELHLFISPAHRGELICQPWEDKHVFYTLDLLLSEGRPLFHCLVKLCPWQSVCIMVMFADQLINHYLEKSNIAVIIIA